MAIIGKIRQRSTLVLIIIGGAIMAFVLTDLFSAKAGGGQQGPINLGEVNGEQITPTEYELKVQRAYENYQSNSQSQEPLDERTKASIREQVWNQFMSDILVGGQMNQLGVKVTTKELFDMVQGDNPHPQVKQAFTNPQTGEFNSAAVVQFLQNLDQNPEAKQQWVQFEKALKTNQRVEKFNTLVKKGIYFPSELAAKDFADQSTTVSFNYVYKSFSSLSDTSVNVSEEDLQEYYDEHKSDYEQEASRKVLYAYFPVAPSTIDVQQARNYMQDLKSKFANAKNDSLFVNANSDDRFDPRFYSVNSAPSNADTALWNKEVGAMTDIIKDGNDFYLQKVAKVKMAPDSIKARHILISTQNKELEQANRIADSLKTEIENGSNFQELAKSFSEDPASAEQGGDLGWFGEGMMVKPFNDAAFAADTGEVKVVQTQFGVHLIKVEEKTAPRKKVQLAVVRREALASKETYAEVFNKANSFSIEATDLESFNSLVTEGNIQRRNAVLSENDSRIQGLPASNDIVRWVRDANEGDISEAYDTDEAFVVAIVESVNQKGIAPLEKVKNQVEYLAKQDKKAEMFIEQMNGASDLNSIAKKLKTEVASAENLTMSNPVIPSVGREPKVVGKAMSLETGQMSVPIKGNSGVFVLEITKKIDAGEPNIVATRTANTRGVNSRVDNGAILTALKEKAEIEDNRSKFY